MTELVATHPMVVQRETQIGSDGENFITHDFVTVGGNEIYPAPPTDSVSNNLTISTENRKMIRVASQSHDQEGDIPEVLCIHQLSTTYPGAMTSPVEDSNPEQKDFRDDGTIENNDEEKAHSISDESYTNLLDISRGYDEGRCKKVGQYLLGRTIGEGSYGKIRLATHLISKQRVAVKVVAKKTLVQNEAARRHFRREALMLQRLHHPHVTRLYQALETGNCYYLVFELAPGGSLLHVLSRQ
ncbi:hormonally up-regulated Neu-associated kinase [Elysia marginata]|uniref:Hormonally up-regulated Neu-associated kinase n=1 Tax=Elysia marginata TaxID=1093978 RepID=A0AAV4H327_9GAST|nr:hormonally up-regulated Neu-associated kinase [Elysia marginata]